MLSITPTAPSDASVKALQDRFNRDVQVSIRQIRDEVEERLSSLETRMTEMETVWEKFYTVEWPEQKLIITSNTNRISALESAIAALQEPPPL